MRRRLIIFSIILVVLASLIGGSVFSTYRFFVADGPLESQRNIYIAKGQSLKSVASYLKQEGVLSSSSVFVIGVRAHQKAEALQSGEYIVPPHASPEMVMNILTGGQTVIRKLTIPEGLTSEQIVKLLNENDSLKGQITEIPANGTLLPETYYYSLFDTKESILIRMQESMKKTLSELWQNRSDKLPFKEAEEAVTMASIIEKETSVTYERDLIASVFFNRLAKNMRLQSDPTVLFAITDGKPYLKKRLFYKDLKVENPYNTYFVQGLPPHPICNPGKSSLEAVFHPAETSYLYFVADGSGAHVFAKNYSEHSKNVLAWRRVRRNRPEIRRRVRARRKQEAIPLPPPLPVPTMPKEQETEVEQLFKETVSHVKEAFSKEKHDYYRK